MRSRASLYRFDCESSLLRKQQGENCLSEDYQFMISRESDSDFIWFYIRILRFSSNKSKHDLAR